MKHTYLPGLTETILLLAIYLLLLAGCSSNKSKSIVYKAEELYLKAEKIKQKAGIRPDLSGPEIRKQIKDAYFKVTNFCWENVDSIAVEQFARERKDLESIAFLATNRLTQIYFAEKKFDSTIFIVRQLLNFTSLEGLQLLASQLNLANAFQSLGKFDETIRIYNRLLDTFYPPIDSANAIIDNVLNLPMEITRIYNLIGDDSAAAGQRNSAQQYYNRLISDWPNSNLEKAARRSLGRLQYDAGNWDKAIEEFSLVKDSTGKVDVNAAMMIASIMLNEKKAYADAISMYDDLLTRVDDTTILAAIQTRRGIAHFEMKEYDECRAIMSNINDEYPSFFRANPRPQKYIALCFEKLGDWIRAENEFKWLIDNYPTTEAAFDAYLAVAEHHEKEENKDLAVRWYGRAEEFYYSMANRYAGSNIEASAISYLAEAARRQKKWELAVKYLESLYNKFPGTDIGRNALINASAVYREKLNNIPKADSLIERFKRELFPLEESKNINIATDDNKYIP